jgi:L-amino acid N-acyltransferase YncA
MKWRTRLATPADATAIYNEGITDSIATFETEPRSARQITDWFTGHQLLIVAEGAGTEPVAYAASFPYSPRPCYAGVGEFSVYVRRECRGHGAGRAVLAALIEAAKAGGLHKLTSREFPENRRAAPFLRGSVSRKSGSIGGTGNWTAAGVTA